MFNPLNASQEAELCALIQQHGLEQIEKRILSVAQNAVALEGAEKETAVGCRLGGLPDVPCDWIWPQDLCFLGQFNLEEIAPHDHNHLLPPRGLLSFFFSVYASDEVQRGWPHRVFYFDDCQRLQRAKAPRGYLPHGLAEGTDLVIYNTLHVAPRSIISLPALYTQDWETICSVEGQFDSDIDHSYLQLLGSLGADRNQLLGHHSFMDGDAYEEAWSFMKGVDEQRGPLSAEETQATLEKFKHEWVLLFQMDSDDRVGTMFNDAGIAYFMILKEHLAAARFDGVYAGMWSS
jgi:uncharacterized protein YwqG